MPLPEIATALSGKNVFVTGVTGFVGLVLVEKLIRSVPSIGTIYVLIRPKRGKILQERLDEIKESSIFETLINMGKKSELSKLVAVGGSIDADKLGLSDEDEQRLINEVNYVFHCAATLDFEASLKTTFEVNTLGTRKIVELCKQMQNLLALVHVSSVYAHSNKSFVKEVLYAPPEKVNDILALVKSLSDAELEAETPRILKDHPNTYTFTKALAEEEVVNAFKTIPCCIVRPSMIVGAWKEPVSGWTNSKNGPQGFIMGAAMGVVRRLPVNKYLVYDYIPVDVVVNTMIVGAVYTTINRNELRMIPAWHCTSSTCNPFRWTDVEDKVNELLHKYPLAQAIWYPHLKLLPSIRLFRISAIIFHFIPAYILDGVTRIAGGRPKLVRLHTNINQSLDRLKPFIFQEWMFYNKHTLKLQKELASTDQETFNIDITSLCWPDFFDSMGQGVRRYLHRENDSTLPKARSKDKALKVANWVLQCFLVALSFVVIKSAFGISGWDAALFIFPAFFLSYTIL